ncbi:MAG: hypothetical protein M5R38_08135 [Candidatus Methylomirabilis sp.]|nr:hypothetical protein [Candidatus Methylomirabilis sp.]
MEGWFHAFCLFRPRAEIEQGANGDVATHIEAGGEQKEKLVGRYIQQVREIAKARLSRRELLRMGLVMSGGGLAGLHGLGNARLSWAHSESESSPVCLGIPQDVWINDPTTLISPRNTPFVDPLPIPPSSRRPS